MCPLSPLSTISLVVAWANVREPFIFISSFSPFIPFFVIELNVVPYSLVICIVGFRALALAFLLYSLSLSASPLPVQHIHTHIKPRSIQYTSRAHTPYTLSQAPYIVQSYTSISRSGIVFLLSLPPATSTSTSSRRNQVPYILALFIGYYHPSYRIIIPRLAACLFFSMVVG